MSALSLVRSGRKGWVLPGLAAFSASLSAKRQNEEYGRDHKKKGFDKEA
jgi:hypothetical protein